MSERERQGREANPLWLEPEEMRRIGYRTVDMLVDGLADPAQRAPLRVASPEEMRRRLDGGPPADGQDYDAILAELEEHVLPFTAHWGHPGYFAFIPGAGTFPGALGDLIAAAWNVDAGSWTWGSGPSHVELLVLDWFKDWIGYPGEAAGVLVSGGSAANLTALACARESLAGPMSDELVAYCSDQAHSSIARAARALGFRPEQVRVLPTDDRFRLRPDALAATMEADVAEGRRPLFVAAAAGTTNTGAVDPFAELAQIAHRHGAWLHVDGAYGGFAALTERGSAALAGMELADSIALDPHKWLYQPFECGCLMVREGRLLDEAFVITPDYLKEVQPGHQEVNFSDRSFQLTRISRALKLWVSLKYFGIDAFRAAIDRSLDLAQLAERRVIESRELELMLPASLGVTCFRRRFEGVEDEEALARGNARLVKGLEESGLGLVSSTRLRGRYAIRLCVLNHTTAAVDVERVIDWLEAAEVSPADAVDAVEAVANSAPDRHPDAAAVRLERDRIDAASLRSLPFFSPLSEEQLERVAGSARLMAVEAGEPIVRMWEAARDFYVIAEGTAEVRDDTKHLGDLGPGDFFGELAALEWGAGYGYPRLANVIASSPIVAVVLSSDALNALRREVPEVAERMRAAVQERLPR
ncbi:MAG: aromatic-L-amino-acid/L-tryptophan decarboxylase [Thermoleophilaceae bacterium]|nr:aromatic-L-amino-acid/L-tryptophan decarboxylase [Thermoleophilaceae bacterium]